MKIKRRILRVKNPSLRFFCPLCSTERFISCKPGLSLKNYLDISLISIVLMLAFYPLMEMRVFFIFFVVWGVMEMAKRLLFKKQLPCPHCGFDASWYKKDVKATRKLIKDFWKKKTGNDTTTAKDQLQEN